MTNICSRISYDEIKSNGYLGKRQALYLSIFTENEELTHYQATKKVFEIYGVSMPQRNGRIAELEAMGLLVKTDQVKCEKTGHIVNRWIWTGRIKPLEFKNDYVTCNHCQGKGKVLKKVYSEKPKKDLFDN